MSVEISGIQNHPLSPDYGCPYCENLNSVYILDRIDDCTWQATGELECSTYFATPIYYSLRIDLLSSGASDILMVVSLSVYTENYRNSWVWQKTLTGPTIDCGAEYTMLEADRFYYNNFDEICADEWPSCVVN
jgi:hypothetical protein